MTPREFRLHVEGYRRRLEHEHERLAWHAAVVINGMPSFSKRRKTITVDDLLGRRKGAFTSADDFREYMSKRAQRD